ncbi:MAG TPA: tRNA (adenosine(37)-N6)-threonylcarbamoyltransferase complex dimerization subunit type 1 TsaB [Acidobacteriaceae bacterium]
MILLGIDTCGAVGTLALGRLEAGELQVLASRGLAGRTSAAMLVPAMAELLAEAGVELAALRGVVVADGPGSFTGIRIGLSAAKALAEALGCAVFPISRLRVMAASHAAAGAVLDAGRGEFYWAGPEPETEAWVESLLTREELAATVAMASGIVVACEERVALALDACSSFRLVEPPTAVQTLQAALAEVQADRRADVASLDGRYLRRSDLYQPAGATHPAP